MTLKQTLPITAFLTLGAGLLAGCNSPAPTTSTGSTTGEGTASTTGSSGTAAGGAKRPAVTAAPIEFGGPEVTIGLVASKTGDLQPWGVDCVAGAQLAVAEFNKTRKEGEFKVKLLEEDSASDPKQGQTATDRLLSKGAVGIIGEVASGITAQIAESAYKAGVPVVAVGATRTDLTDRGANVFRVCYTDAFQGPVMARFAFEDLGLKNIAIMTDNEQPYSVGLSESFRKKFTELGGTIVAEEFYKSKDTQFTPQITNIKSKSPDGLFLSGYFTEVGQIARQVGEQQLNVKLLGGDGWDSQEILTGGGDSIVGGYFCNHYNSKENRPEVSQFLSKWKSANGGKEPGTTMGALGYDATMLLCDALKRSTAPNTKALIEAIDNTENFPGVSGSITLKGHGGNPPKRALVVEITKEGQNFAKAFEYFQ